jgi:phospho-acceptor domain-containing protein/histidine kinase/DNA gyrase B/HSP90-like ATPase
VLRIVAAMKLHRISIERDELALLLRRQRDDVMRLQLQREQLIAFLVHDLKNPVHAIKLNSELIGRDKALSARSQSAAAGIRSDSESLLRMIMNLLDLSKADEGRLVPVRWPIESAELAAEITGAMAAPARSAEVELAAEVAPHTVHADPDLVRRVLENLVDNAIRHARAETRVRISSAAHDASVDLRVADAAPASPPPCATGCSSASSRATPARAAAAAWARRSASSPSTPRAARSGSRRPPGRGVLHPARRGNVRGREEDLSSNSAGRVSAAPEPWQSRAA